MQKIQKYDLCCGKINSCMAIKRIFIIKITLIAQKLNLYLENNLSFFKEINLIL